MKLISEARTAEIHNPCYMMIKTAICYNSEEEHMPNELAAPGDRLKNRMLKVSFQCDWLHWEVQGGER